MSIATEILSLRREKSSSVATLIGLIEWEQMAYDRDHKVSRHYAVLEAADLVLLNVAAHAAEAMSEPPETRKTRRTLFPFRRKPRRSDPGQLHQRRLFAYRASRPSQRKAEVVFKSSCLVWFSYRLSPSAKGAS